MDWIKQTEAVPEMILGYEETAEYHTPSHGWTVYPDGREEPWFKDHQDLHYITAPVLVRRHVGDAGQFRYSVDIRRKFDSWDNWCWCRHEGAEDDENLEWMPIPGAKVTDDRY